MNELRKEQPSGIPGNLSLVLANIQKDAHYISGEKTQGPRETNDMMPSDRGFEIPKKSTRADDEDGDPEIESLDARLNKLAEKNAKEREMVFAVKPKEPNAIKEAVILTDEQFWGPEPDTIKPCISKKVDTPTRIPRFPVVSTENIEVDNEIKNKLLQDEIDRINSQASNDLQSLSQSTDFEDNAAKDRRLLEEINKMASQTHQGAVKYDDFAKYRDMQNHHGVQLASPIKIDYEVSQTDSEEEVRQNTLSDPFVSDEDIPSTNCVQKENFSNKEYEKYKGYLFNETRPVMQTKQDMVKIPRPEHRRMVHRDQPKPRAYQLANVSSSSGEDDYSNDTACHVYPAMTKYKKKRTVSFTEQPSIFKSDNEADEEFIRSLSTAERMRIEIYIQNCVRKELDARSNLTLSLHGVGAENTKSTIAPQCTKSHFDSEFKNEMKLHLQELRDLRISQKLKHFDLKASYEVRIAEIIASADKHLNHVINTLEAERADRLRTERKLRREIHDAEEIIGELSDELNTLRAENLKQKKAISRLKNVINKALKPMCKSKSTKQSNTTFSDITMQPVKDMTSSDISQSKPKVGLIKRIKSFFKGK